MHIFRPAATIAIALALLCGSGTVVLAQDAERAASSPVTVTGTLACERASAEDPASDDVAGPDHAGPVTRHTWDASDPRLTGSAAYVGRWRLYDQPSAETCSCSATAAAVDDEQTTYRVVNDGGSWLCVTTRANGPIETGSNAHTVVLQGEDAYAGLTAYLVIDWGNEPFTFAGLIVPGEVPPYAPPEG